MVCTDTVSAGLLWEITIRGLTLFRLTACWCLSFMYRGLGQWWTSFFFLVSEFWESENKEFRFFLPEFWEQKKKKYFLPWPCFLSRSYEMHTDKNVITQSSCCLIKLLLYLVPNSSWRFFMLFILIWKIRTC